MCICMHTTCRKLPICQVFSQEPSRNAIASWCSVRFSSGAARAFAVKILKNRLRTKCSEKAPSSGSTAWYKAARLLLVIFCCPLIEDSYTYVYIDDTCVYVHMHICSLLAIKFICVYICIHLVYILVRIIYVLYTYYIHVIHTEHTQTFHLRIQCTVYGMHIQHIVYTCYVHITYIHAHTHTHTYVYTCTCTCAYTFTFAFTPYILHLASYTYMFIYIYLYT